MKKESRGEKERDLSWYIASIAGLLITLVLSVLLIEVSRPQVTSAYGNNQPQTVAKTRGETKLIARGKYIVEGVAACGDCHTPRSRNGDIDRSKWLQGAPVFYEPAQRVDGWAISAPRISGLPPGRDAEIITLLTTATWRDGKPPRPPMPRFHMTREDAEAVVAYLKSL